MINPECNKTTFSAGALLSERTGRGLSGRRRRTPATTINGSANGRSGSASKADLTPSLAAPARSAAVLRRWSVAELIARAAAGQTGARLS